MRIPRLVVALLLMAAPMLVAQEDVSSAPLTIRVDSARHEVVLTAGPFDLPSMAGHGHDPSMMSEYTQRFEWPVEAMGRGFTLELRDASGQKVSQRVLHHLQIANNSRRQLLLPLRERVMAIGRETRNIMLPNTIGMPLARGSRMRLNIMWHNETPRDVQGVTATLRIRYSPANLLPAPTTVLPMSIDLADAQGKTNTFTIPPGGLRATREFVMPVDGRLLGASGHMHDWGQSVALEDVSTGKTVLSITTTLDSVGRIRNMPVKLYGIAGRGIRLHAGRHYRLVATYLNPTGEPLEGGMAHLNAILAPSDLRQWPALADQAVAYVDDGAPSAGETTPHSH